MSMSKLASVHDINSDFTSWKRGDFIIDNKTNDAPRLYFWDGRSIIPPYTLKDDGICIPPDFTVNEFSDVRYHESIRGHGIKNFKYVIWVKIKPENIDLRENAKIILQKRDLNHRFDVNKIILDIFILRNTTSEDLFNDVTSEGLVRLKFVRNTLLNENYYKMSKPELSPLLLHRLNKPSKTRRSYLVEFIHENSTDLVGIFSTRRKAKTFLKREHKRWSDIYNTNTFTGEYFNIRKEYIDDPLYRDNR